MASTFELTFNKLCLSFNFTMYQQINANVTLTCYLRSLQGYCLQPHVMVPLYPGLSCKVSNLDWGHLPDAPRIMHEQSVRKLRLLRKCQIVKVSPAVQCVNRSYSNHPYYPVRSIASSRHTKTVILHAMQWTGLDTRVIKPQQYHCISVK